MFEESARQSLKSIAWIIIAVAALTGVVEYGRSVDKTYPTRTFSVEGEGTIDVKPDVAKFSVSVLSEGGKDVGALQSANTEKMNRVTAFLRETGIEERDLKTEEYTLEPRYDYPNCVGLAVCPQPTIAGYRLNQALRVTVRSTEVLGDLLSGVVANGGNSVSQVVFTVEDEDEAKALARKEAITKAEEKALRIAADAGFSIGKLVSIYETPVILGYGGDSEMALRGQGGGGMGAAPAIQPGTNETKVTVTMTYEIR
jgi:uncharacterized protein